MAILLKSSSYTDIYGNVTSNFKANAGDTILCSHIFESEISCMSNDTNVITVIKLENKVTRGQGSFIKDGFRVGDTYYMKIVNDVNSLTATHTGTINEVYDNYMIVSGLPSVNNVSSASSGNIIYIYTEEQYDSLDFGFNFIDNNNPNATLESFIDQETSRFTLSAISSMVVTDILTPIQIGKKSGQFAVSNVSFERLTDASNPYSAFNTTRQKYELSFKIVFSGMLDEELFNGNNCLRYFFQGKFKRSSNENYEPTLIEVNETSDTGYFDEGFNSENPICSQDLKITNLYYNKTNDISVSFTIDNTSISQVELGGCYVTLDDTFNFNKQQSQSDLLPLLRSGLVGIAQIGTTYSSSTTYNFDIKLVDFSYVDALGQRTFTIDLQFLPYYTTTGKFGQFVEGRGDLEREFKLWIKVGNVNKLIFDGSLSYEVPVGVAFIPPAKVLMNHDNNEDFTDLTSAVSDDADINVEDDLAFLAHLNILEADTNQSVRASIVVKNDITDEEFELESISFDLSQQDLTYFKPLYTNVSNNLPSSSNKKQAFLIEYTPLSAGTIVLRLYYPFIVRWENWIEQLQSSPYFEANALNTQNWYNYITGDWKVYIKIEIGRNNVFDFYYKELPIANYDSWAGTSTIQLYDETETTLNRVLVSGSKMLIKATHVFPIAYVGYPYGQITIEPSESSPRYILSTEVDRTQSENPLKGILNPDRCDIEFYDATTIILRCYVDTNMLKGNNFCITSKISEEGQNNNFVETEKLTEAGEDKIMENGTDLKITE